MSLKFSYSEANDIMDIEGRLYSGDLFRQLGTQAFHDGTYKIESKDGVLTIYEVCVSRI